MDDTRIWAPLVQLAPQELESFMWMFELELEDGSFVHAYKHRATRRYIYLDEGGRAFDEVRQNRFLEVELQPLLMWALEFDP